jgi:hypothetical protein
MFICLTFIIFGILYFNINVLLIEKKKSVIHLCNGLNLKDVRIEERDGFFWEVRFQF